MNTRQRARVLVALLLVALAWPAGATADPQSRPNGPWAQEAEQLSLEGLHSYPEMVAELRRIEDAADDRMRLERVGASNEDRGVWLASVGSGDRSVLYLAQQHGNEPHGSEAALAVLRTLATSDSPAVQQIRSELTIHVMPRVNPDGAERYWRQNVDPECDPDVAHCIPGRGFDVNRWHDPTVPDETVPAPEALAVREVHARFAPELVVDLHGQLSYAAEDGDLITTSLAWPVITDATPEQEAAVRYSQQAVGLIADTLDRYGHAEVSQFPLGTGSLATARNAYAYQGSASVLVEQRSDAGQKSLGMLVRQAYVALMDVTAAVADESVHDIDPSTAEALPARGPAVGDPHPMRPRPCQPEREQPGGGDVIEIEDSLYNVVLAHEDRLVPRGSESYVVPTEEEACTMGAGFARLQNGDLEGAAALVDRYGYAVARLSDPDTGRTHLALMEEPGSDSVYTRGWGLFVHSPKAQTEVTVVAAYPRSATFSERLGAQLYDEVAGQDLLVAGAHREANRADATTYEPANTTTATVSALRRVHAEAVDRGELSVQTLGASGSARAVSVTSGTVPPTDLAAVIGDALVQADYHVCLFGDGECTGLGSTGNLLMRDGRALGAEAATVYPSYDIRRLLANRAELAAVLAPALSGD